MPNKTGISWTDLSSNPIRFERLDLPYGTKQRGRWYCEKVSDGCKYCYAEALSLTVGNKLRFNKGNRSKVKAVVDHKELASYRNLPAGTKVFVGSMTDLLAFNEFMSPELFYPVWLAMWDNPHVIFQILTKRPGNYHVFEQWVRDNFDPWRETPEWFSGWHDDDNSAVWSGNIWLGTTVEDDRYQGRIDVLRQVPGDPPNVRFLSVEPMLGPLTNPNLTGISWVICGGESGPNKRLFDKVWAQELQQVCAATNTAFWFKQGSNIRPGADTLLNGREFKEWPVVFHSECA